MRRLLVFAGLIALVLVGAAALEGKNAWHRLHWKNAVDPAPGQHVTIARPNGRPLRVLFIGDSLTVGYFAATRATAFPQLVTAALRRQGRVTEIVRAKGGVRVSYWTHRPLPAADVAVIELGTNDFSTKPTPPAVFDRDYHTLVAHIHARQVLCLSVWRSSQYGYGSQSVATYNRIVANDCPGAFVFLSNLYDRRYYAASNDRKPVGAASFLGRTDGFHPNAQGHRDIAAAILQAIRIR